MKKVILLITLAIVLVGCENWVEYKGYNVEITYCDSRPKKIIYVEVEHYPNNRDILSGKYYPTPKYYNELNVCEIKVLKVINLKSGTGN